MFTRLDDLKSSCLIKLLLQVRRSDAFMAPQKGLEDLFSGQIIPGEHNPRPSLNVLRFEPCSTQIFSPMIDG